MRTRSRGTSFEELEGRRPLRACVSVEWAPGFEFIRAGRVGDGAVLDEDARRALVAGLTESGRAVAFGGGGGDPQSASLRKSRSSNFISRGLLVLGPPEDARATSPLPRRAGRASSSLVAAGTRHDDELTTGGRRRGPRGDHLLHAQR